MKHCFSDLTSTVSDFYTSYNDDVFGFLVSNYGNWFNESVEDRNTTRNLVRLDETHLDTDVDDSHLREALVIFHYVHKYISFIVQHATQVRSNSDSVFLSSVQSFEMLCDR